MQNQNENSTDLKILVGIGVLALVLMVFAPAALFVYVTGNRTQTPTATSTQSSVTMPEIKGRLGELGSTCGGEGHLPCRPGLQCSTGLDFSKYGTCEVGQEASAQNPRIRQLGEACSYDSLDPKDCAPGLVCKMQAVDGIQGKCATPGDSDIKMVSVKLDGAEPVKGMYYVDAAKGLGVTVTAVNADSVKDAWSPDNGSKSETALKRQPGGVYVSPSRGSWQKASGTLTVRAFAKNGDFMTLDYRIATKE